MSYQWISKVHELNINTNLIFNDSFQSLSSSLDRLVKNLSKNDFKYLSRKFDSSIIDLVKQKQFDPHEIKSDFEKFKK